VPGKVSVSTAGCREVEVAVTRSCNVVSVAVLVLAFPGEIRAGEVEPLSL